MGFQKRGVFAGKHRIVAFIWRDERCPVAVIHLPERTSFAVSIGADRRHMARFDRMAMPTMPADENARHGSRGASSTRGVAFALDPIATGAAAFVVTGLDEKEIHGASEGRAIHFNRRRAAVHEAAPHHQKQPPGGDRLWLVARRQFIAQTLANERAS